MSVSAVFDGGRFKMTDAFPFLLNRVGGNWIYRFLAAPAEGPERISPPCFLQDGKVFLRQRTPVS
jgi:hypothetical protein